MTRQPAPETVRISMQANREDLQALRKLIRHYGTADAGDALRLSIYDALIYVEDENLMSVQEALKERINRLEEKLKQLGVSSEKGD